MNSFAMSNFSQCAIFCNVQFFSYYYYLSPLRVIPTNASRGFLTDFTWQQVSSSFRDSSQYSDRYFSYFSLSFNFTLWSAGQQSPQFGKFSSCWLSLGLVVWSRLVDAFVSQNPRGVYASHFPIVHIPFVRRLVGCLGFMAYQPLLGYLTPNLF